MYARCAAMFMTLSSEILTMVLSREQNGKMYLMTGNARCAELQRMSFKRKNKMKWLL
jgi:hypothetical protein